jgi:preprotein translocase subunit SecE
MTSPIVFVSQTLDELKKVVWPSRQELLRLTAVVLLISLVVGVYIGGLDFTFTKLFEFLVNIKVK